MTLGKRKNKMIFFYQTHLRKRENKKCFEKRKIFIGHDFPFSMYSPFNYIILFNSSYLKILYNIYWTPNLIFLICVAYFNKYFA